MIHQYINNGYYIVLDVNSGSVHVVDPVVYDAIQAVSELVGELEDPRPLTEGEQEVYRRGRNAHVNHVPKNADPADYHAATALETLFG